MNFSVKRMFQLRRQTCRALVFFSALGLAAVVPAQDEGGEEDILELSPFLVSTDRDVGYLSTNSTSGTSLNVAIKDLPMAIQVINQEFITDLGASNLEESLLYTSGVFTSDNQTSTSSTGVGSTRGTQGGGSGDRSISSAASGDRFANNVYIRGLATPFQNRNGFRNGGLVVTTDSAIALGGLLDAANIERIEVVKGPNSLLYGVGVLTGIVNVIPERPLAEPRSEVTFRLGSDDFKRVQVDFTGPVQADWIPGQLNWRVAGSFEDKGHYTDFRATRTEYWVAQLEYMPNDWSKLFLEYPDGYTRIDGIGSQWIYDGINNANDTEFRTEFDEAFNWARHEGTIPGLRPLDPTGYNATYQTINDDGALGLQPGFRLLDNDFVGGGRGQNYRITGPDTYAERDEQNFMADLELYPSDDLTINIGAFLAQQETEELTLQFNSIVVADPNNFVSTFIPTDAQLQSIWESGGIYGVPMQDAVKDLVGISSRVNPAAHPGSYILPATTDDVKMQEYWWRESIVKSESQQFRVRATYNFETPFIRGDASHTLLVGYSYLHDDVDFPDGSINRANARANRSFDHAGTTITAGSDALVPTVDRRFDQDGLYYRSIANFEPLYFDGRNDGVDGHNTVRDGDAYLNQKITQQGFYGVYQGKFFKDRLEIIMGVRQDRYNAEQATYKRVDIDDDYLREIALSDVRADADRNARSILGFNTIPDVGTPAYDQYLSVFEPLVASATSSDVYISTYYRESIESGDQGYFGYADRGGAADANFGIVPGSSFDVFAEDVEVTTATFGASFDINESLTFYALAAQGVSPNTALRDGSGDIIPAEETFNKEIGLKFDFFGGKLSGNLTFFQIDRENAIWDMDLAPAAAKWVDAALSPNRSSDWTTPTYDPTEPTTYYVRGDYLSGFLSEAFGIPADKISFAQVGSQLVQQIALADLDPSLPIRDRIAIVNQVKAQSLFPESFSTGFSSQAPFNGNVQIDVVALSAEGMDDLNEITLYNPETSEFVTRRISNLAALYAAFSDREVDKTKNSLLQEIHPIRYRRFTSFGQPQANNNVDFDQAQGALVTFDETINGFEFELFLTPTDNLQFVINYSHIEREANDTFNFTDWRNISGSEQTFVPAYTMLHREYGWEAAGLQPAWVDYDAYASAVSAAGGEAVALADLSADAVELIPLESADARIEGAEFAQRNNDGQIFILVDKRGNFVNEANNAQATDYDNILSGVSLNFNPEDELSIWGKYSFKEGRLKGLAFTAGFKYTGPSETSIAFRSVSPLNALTVTPEVSERIRFDLGLTYGWRWEKVDMKLSLNIYDVFEDTYDVTTTELGIPNPITGETVTKRTEKFYAPTAFRVGLTASF